jgi:hypothetical protein
MCDGRLAETNTDRVKALQIGIAQIGKTLTDVVDSFVHPVLLIIFFRLQNATAVNVTEQLVTSSVHKLIVRQIVLHSTYRCERAFSTPGRDLSFSRIT